MRPKEEKKKEKNKREGFVFNGSLSENVGERMVCTFFGAANGGENSEIYAN